MAPQNDDNSWMDSAESEDDEELKELRDKRNELERKAKNGRLTAEESLTLYRTCKTIQSRERITAAERGLTAAVAGDGDGEEEEEESLFVQDDDPPAPSTGRGRGKGKKAPAANAKGKAVAKGKGKESREDVVQRHIQNIPTGDDNSESGDEEDIALQRMMEDEFDGDGLEGPDGSTTGGSKKGKGKGKAGAAGKSKKGTGKRPANAREFHEQQNAKREKERNKTQKRRGRPASKKTKSKPEKDKGKGKSKKDKGKGKKGDLIVNGESLLKAKGWNAKNGNDDIGQMILEDLMTHDPINERLQNPIFDVEPEPEIHGQQKKADQFRRLFANIPSGGSARTIAGDKKKLREASRSFGYAKVRAVNGKWLVKGMKSTLYHHQLLGAQWMVSRELNAEPPHGGLLADSMGLGKTVQTLACMVGNPPSAEDIERKVKATLIVVPAAVIDQWYDEIKFHAEERMFRKVLKYRSSAGLDVSILEDVDIVITTYNEVMKQFPFPDKKGREMIQQAGYKRWWRMAIQHLGDLHKALPLPPLPQSKLQHGLVDLPKILLRPQRRGMPFAYRHFVKLHDDEKNDENYDFESSDYYVAATASVRAVFAVFGGGAGYLSYSRGDIRRNYGMFMVQLLRLRQCTSHPFMLERTIKENWTIEDVQELRHRLDRLGSSRSMKPFYEQTLTWVKEGLRRRDEDGARTSMGSGVLGGGVRNRIAAENGNGEGPPHSASGSGNGDVVMSGANGEGNENGESGRGEGELLPFGQGDFGLVFNMDKAIESLSQADMWERTTLRTYLLR
ncbi:hypothetical protein G7Y89_g15801 [Cudoniella acicularis]|uniref:Helicase ATP-binding domain-containing protein n=1 Tax=Cudoniella acicularis TaxID=354080 RepID=A0A8H4VHV8_9HELO|nr:hypothetical protein G7Y89_g15801 [Cudoniella acicularis]